MADYYEVCAGSQPVGKVQLISQGLYVRICCHCQTPTDQVYRLFAVSPDRRENLGVVVPEGDGFILDRKIPAKRLGSGQLQFILSSGGAEKRGEYTPICPEEPFWYLHRVKEAFLHSCRGKATVQTGT